MIPPGTVYYDVWNQLRSLKRGGMAACLLDDVDELISAELVLREQIEG